MSASTPRATSRKKFGLHAESRPFGKAPSGRYCTRRVVDLVRTRGQALTARELAQGLDIATKDATTMAERAVRAGWLREQCSDDVVRYGA